MQPTPPITGQAAKITTSRVGDAAETTLVCVVHLNVAPSYAEVYAIARNGVARLIGRNGDTGGRVDSASAEAYADGTVRLWTSAIDAGQSGTTAHVAYYDFPGAVGVPVAGGGGSIKSVVSAIIGALAPLAQ